MAGSRWFDDDRPFAALLPVLIVSGLAQGVIWSAMFSVLPRQAAVAISPRAEFAEPLPEPR